MKPAHARYYWSHLSGAVRVLDLGCGDGAIGRYKPHGTLVYGLDSNQEALAQARENEIVQAWDLDSPGPIPFSDSYFDAVVAKDILEHLQQPWRTMMEIKRVIRPGGIVLASVICERGRCTWSDYTHVRGFTMESVRRMFEDAGLEVLSVWRMGGVPFSSRLHLIWLVPYLLCLPPCDWIWTSSYEIRSFRVPCG